MAFLFPEIYLIDGENLVARYQAMLKSGRTPKPGLVHIRDVLVWHPSLIGAITGDIRRVLYYASAVGDDAYIAKIEGQIRCFEYSCSDGILRRRSHVMSRVFKKLSKSQKSRSVDINITIDSLRYARGGHAGVIVLYSGAKKFFSALFGWTFQDYGAGLRGLR